MAPSLVLIGSPGAGKSSVGRRVAERLGVAFADSDHLIEAAAGKSIADMFVDEGEDAFRDLEATTIAQALVELDGVLALGGGSVLRQETRDRLVGSRVVWLKVDASDAAARVGMNTARPLLLGNVRSKLVSLLKEREPVYAQVATATVDTSGKSLDEVSRLVLEVAAGE